MLVHNTCGGNSGNVSKQKKSINTTQSSDISNSSNGSDFYVTESGDVVPATKEGLKKNLSLMQENNGKYVGESSRGPVRVRVEEAHDPDPDFKGIPNPDHYVDHIHIEYRKNGQSDPWGKGRGNKTTLPWVFFK